jgi:hypothetical protein
MGFAMKVRNEFNALYNFLLLFGFYFISLNSFASSPTTLTRTPLKMDSQLIWELTKSHAENWAGNSILNYPCGIDVKNIKDSYFSLTVITDCGWSRLINVRTDWEGERAIDHIKSFGNVGPDEGEFRYPDGVAIGNYNGIFESSVDRIYVTDALNKRVVILEYDIGLNELSWGDAFGMDVLVNPRGILYYDFGTETRSDDEIFVTDIGISKILKFSWDGSLLGEYGNPGQNYGEILSPYGICGGPSGSEWEECIYISDIYNYKVCKFELNGDDLSFVNEYSFNSTLTFCKLMGITISDNGNLYVADRYLNRILKFDPELNLMAIIDAGSAGPDFNFFKPQVVRYYNNTLVVIDKFTETSGIKAFIEEPLDTLKWPETWYGDVTLGSDLVIPCGSSLTLKPGTTIEVPAQYDGHNLGNDLNRVEITVEGTLNSLGLPSDSVKIKSMENPGSPGDWYGIRVQEPCGEAHLNFTSIRDAEYGIEFYDDTHDQNHVTGVISNSQISNNATAGIYSNNGVLSIINNIIFDNSVYGFYGSKTVADIYKNQFIGNGRYGIWVNLLSNPPDSVRILNNVINGEDKPTTIDGLYLSHPQARVEGCHIRGYVSTGVHIQGGNSPLFMLDTLNCKTGMDCRSGASPIVRYNRIFHDYLNIGVNVDKMSFPNLGDTERRGNNSIFVSSMTEPSYYIVNENSNEVFAQNNWWGTDHPQRENFKGPVRYSPWLLGEPQPPRLYEYREVNIPASFFVSNNYPNPFNPITRIDYNIPANGHVTVSVYNILGQLVNTLKDEDVIAGYYNLKWDATDMNGSTVGSGIYLISFTYQDQKSTRKVLLLR